MGHELAAIELGPPSESSVAPSRVAQVVPETSLDKTFDYSIPAELQEHVTLGSKVRIPFRSRLLVGYVVSVSKKPSADAAHISLKPIDSVLAARSFIPASLIQLSQWMAQYYVSPLGTVLKAILPQAVRQTKSGFKSRLWVQLVPGIDPSAVPPVLEKAPAQKAAWLFLVENGPGWLHEHAHASGIAAQVWRGLATRNLISVDSRDQERDPFAELPTPIANAAHTLTVEQQSALDAILTECASEKPRVLLLHGVTGSGKTEVYLQAISRVIATGKSALVLVPEIALTPQTVDRFRTRFIGENAGVAVLHSHLSAGERHDQWQQIRSGRARIVIGVRSAVFAPLEKLGIIVVDEEHEPSYKQEDSPHYQARDVAIMRGHFESAPVVLGSATPSLESFHHALEGKYRLARLLNRPEEIRLPTMHVVDLRTKAPKGQTSPSVDSPELPVTVSPITGLISPTLQRALQLRIDKSEQSIIFINRRGYSSSIQCTQCGQIEMCPHCSVALTFHRADSRLKCHLCDFFSGVPPACPGCGHSPHKHTGFGTEKVEHSLATLFPSARIARMDADTMRQRGAYLRTLTAFASGDIDILVGTQMIAKGLHFPNVTCVGVINSDLALLLPDFRASERVFQLLMQVSGRSGRGQTPGEVFVQTRVPFHPAIQFARHHDYDGFAESESELRRAIHYPPFARFALITAKGRSEDKVAYVMEQIGKELTALNLPQTEIIGPTPAPIAKIEDRYRFQIFLRTTKITALTPKLRPLFIGRAWPDDIHLTVNIDPTDLL